MIKLTLECFISLKAFLFLSFIQFISFSASAQFQSSILHYDDSLRLVYHSDKDGNRIPDFSHSGYKNGEADLPELPVALSIDPISGDNTAHIQAAINQVSALPLDSYGFRGAVLLNPGGYEVQGTLRINKSGVVLRGSGKGDDPATNTILNGTGTNRRTLIIIGYGSNSKWGQKIGSNVNITSEYIPAGSRTFELADASAFSIGDNIIIKHPSTDRWLEAVDYGETHGDVLWQPGEIDMFFNRFITQIEGNKIKVDAPIFHELDRSLSQAYAYKYARTNLVTETGIENLRINIVTSGEFSEDHVWECIKFIRVEDCWAKNVVTQHFGKSGIWLEEATRSTILNCSAIEPHSVVEPPDRYNFYLGSASNNILFKNCHASKARHAFVSNGTSTVSGIVFTACSSVDEYTASESHRRWGQALLYDNTSFNSSNTNRVLGLYNRGDYGTGHGWTGTNLVAWNISAPKNEIVVQKPPLGQNYAIGCKGKVTHIGPFNPHPAGWIEGTGEDMLIESLYEAQLSERLSYGVSPDAPGKLYVTDFSYTDTSKYLSLEWIDIALDEEQYIIERSSDNSQTFEVIATLDENAESFTDTSLTVENHHYRIRAINAIGASAYSNIVQASDYDILPPGSDITDLQGTTIKGSNDDEPWISASEGAGSPPGEEIPMLIDNDINTKYLVRAEASWAEVKNNSYSVVTGYTITSANDAPSRDPRSWKFEGYDHGTGTWVTLHTVVDNPAWGARLKGRSWTFGNSESYNKYRLNISAINGDAQGLMQMAELQIWGEIGDPTSLMKPAVPSFEIYPNPAEDVLYIQNTTGMEFSYELYTLSGKLLSRKEQIRDTSTPIYLNAYIKGMYILKISSGARFEIHKIILQ